MLVLALAFGGLWLASVRWWMRWEPAQGHAIMVSRGVIGLGVPVNPPGARMGNTITAANKGEPMRWRAFRTGTWFHRTHWRPLWWPTAGFSAAAGVLFVLSRRRRGPAWACAACGYDLRGLGAGAACPECGGGGAEGTQSERRATDRQGDSH
ncbi:MAG: hypothetical protein KF699_04650 [Phycisphaeraceae bacterium]|nr:hypothetical protein [Phycisphaeraceae bacterium]